MEDKKVLLKKIQNDLLNSNPKIITNNDNISLIQKTLNTKYSEDLSDSDEELISYKNRNSNIINKINNNAKSEKKNLEKTKKPYLIEDDINNIQKEINNSEQKDKNNKSKKNNENDNQENEENEENEEEDDDEVAYEYSEELKKKVVQYVKNDDRIRELQNELKNLNNIKKLAEKDILKHLDRLGESNINITGGKLRINQYESKEGLKEDIIKEALSEKIKDPILIETIIDNINLKRLEGKKVQISLKRTFERKEKNKKN